MRPHTLEERTHLVRGEVRIGPQRQGRLSDAAGPEFVSRALLEWMQQESIETALADPGKPWQNGAHESFNGNLRDECLSLEWFRSRTEARVVIENWRRHYDAVRPHSSLN